EKLENKIFIDNMFFEKYQDIFSGLDNDQTLGKVNCPSGPCIPGVQRLMVDVDGLLFRCERISERFNMNIIGDVNNGINLEKVKQILNVAEYNIDECKNCFAFRECMSCVKDFQGKLNKIEKSKIECESRREGFHNKLVIMKILEEDLY